MASVPSWQTSEVWPVKVFLLSIMILNKKLINGLLVRAFHGVFFSLRVASCNFVLAATKVQHFLLICKKKDKKVSDLTFDVL